MTTRNTKQKQIISQVIEAAHRPLTVHEILEKGQQHLPNLGLATVYREMNRLTEAGDITTVAIPGDMPRYEACKHHHHHFKCNACDRVYDIEGCSSTLKTLVPEGFKAQSHDLTFYGLCRACA